MFEPVHGSAPDIYDKGIANPIAMIWPGALMLDFLGEKEASLLILEGIGKTITDGKALICDLGGSASTIQRSNEISANILKSRK